MNRAASDNPLGLGLIIVGAVAMAISVFLPLVEPINAFRRVEDNTLIQHDGWVLIALALGIAASGYRANRGTRAWWVPVLLCVLAAGLIVFYANDKDMRTLYPVGPDGNPITTQPGMAANLGIAIYVAGAGVAAALIGSLMLRRREDETGARVAPAPERSGRQHERASRTKPHAERLQERRELEAEVEVAEAEARAAEARARLIRLRREAEAKAKPAPTPQSSTPPPAPAVKPKPPPGVLAPGAPVEVVAAGDEHEGQVGVVRALFNEDEDGLDVCVEFNGDNEGYAFSRDELSVVIPQPRAAPE